MAVAPPLSSPGQRGIAAAVLLGVLLLPAPALARLSAAELGRVAVSPGPGARVPLDLPVTDTAGDRATSLGAMLDGRPALLLPVDYTCGNVCDPMIGLSADALAATGLAAGDRRLVLVGLDPKDDAATARARIAEIWGGRAADPIVLIAGPVQVTRLTEALGYRYAYDAASDSFAHPAAALLLTGDGRLARVLSPLAVNGKDLRLALTEAGEGRIGTLADHLVLLCYGYDAAKGVYTPLVGRILTAGGVLTVLGIGGLIIALVRVRARQEARARL